MAIENERQYEITKEQVVRFSAAVAQYYYAARPGIHPLLLEAERQALLSELEILRDQMRAWENRSKE
jgi:hypothetical protein